MQGSVIKQCLRLGTCSHHSQLLEAMDIDTIDALSVGAHVICQTFLGRVSCPGIMYLTAIKVHMLWHRGRRVNQAYSRLSTTHGHITDCKLYSVLYASICVVI